VVNHCSGKVHHRGTENTEVAKRRIQIRTLLRVLSIYSCGGKSFGQSILDSTARRRQTQLLTAKRHAWKLS